MACRLLLLILVAVSLSLGVRGQSISIQLDTNGEVSLHVEPKAGWGYRIEQSTNWRDWSGASDHLTGFTSHHIDLQNNSGNFYRLEKWELPLDPIKLAVIGDSTTGDFSHYGGSVGGWGEGLARYFGPDIRMGMLAVPGQSTKTYLESGW